MWQAGTHYICGNKGGSYACRPMALPQLASFKDLQKEINGFIYHAKQQGRGYAANLPYLAVDGALGNGTWNAYSKVNGFLQNVAFPVTGPPDLARWAVEITQQMKQLNTAWGVPERAKDGGFFGRRSEPTVSDRGSNEASVPESGLFATIGVEPSTLVMAGGILAAAWYFGNK